MKKTKWSFGSCRKPFASIVCFLLLMSLIGIYFFNPPPQSGWYQVKTLWSKPGRPLVLRMQTGASYIGFKPVNFGFSRDILATLNLGYWYAPQMVIWLETSSGTYIDTILLSQPKLPKILFGEGQEIEQLYQGPAALPIWSNLKGKTKKSFDETIRQVVRSEFSLAGPYSAIELKTKLPTGIQRFRVMLEINRPYDWNEYFHRYRLLNQNGQPSLLYSVEVDLEDGLEVKLLKPIGHGNGLGKDGSIAEDLSRLDTAFTMLSQITVYLPVQVH